MMYTEAIIDTKRAGEAFSPVFEDLMVTAAMKQKTDETPKASFNDLLVAVGQEQDRAAFVALFEHFAPRLKSYLMKQGSNEEQAEELVQAAMLTVWQKAVQYNPKKAAASTWIFTIARNKRIDLLRKESRPEFDLEDPALVPDADDSALDILVQEDSVQTLSAAIKELPQEQSDLIHKSYFEDKSHSEIAAETDLPLGTVKSRLRLALKALRGKLSKENEE